jgi:hypothetical protein
MYTVLVYCMCWLSVLMSIVCSAISVVSIVLSCYQYVVSVSIGLSSIDFFLAILLLVVKLLSVYLLLALIVLCSLFYLDVLLYSVIYVSIVLIVYLICYSFSLLSFSM